MALENFKEAVEDSDKALKLDPTMTRAYYRKASAIMAGPF